MIVELILADDSGSQNVKNTAELTSWIRGSRIDGISEVEQKFKPPKEGEMGPTLLAIIGVVLGADATVELVKQIKNWISATKPKSTVTIVRDGMTFIFEGENFSAEEIASIVNSAPNS